VIIDKVQRKPELFELLRVLVDRAGRKAPFLLLGSASPHFVKGVSESFAGRTGFVDLAGFQLWEVGVEHRDRLWLRGALPKAFLADSESDIIRWRDSFIRTFLERGIPLLGITIAAETLRRFWTMVAHYHGHVWNAAEFARALGTAENTARRYLDILSGAYMIRVLPPWFENLKGTPWEGFSLEHIIKVFRTRDAYFSATHASAELDLMVTIAGKRHGFESKYADAPGRKRSMHVAIEDLGLEHLWVIYPGDQRYALDEKITAIPLEEISQLTKTGIMT